MAHPVTDGPDKPPTDWKAVVAGLLILLLVFAFWTPFGIIVFALLTIVLGPLSLMTFLPAWVGWTAVILLLLSLAGNGYRMYREKERDDAEEGNL